MSGLRDARSRVAGSVPDGHDIVVATDALRRDAEVWSDQCGVLGQAGRAAARMRVDRLQAGVFQLVVDAHNDLAAALADRSREGAGEMARIAATLHQVADTYDEEEYRGVHDLRHLY